MPTLNWLGKDKVVSYDSQVPFHVLDKIYNFGGESQNKIIHGDFTNQKLNAFTLTRLIIPVMKIGFIMIMSTRRKFRNGSGKSSARRAKIIPATINGFV